MSVILEEFLPSANGAGKIGKSGSAWGQGWFTSLYANGSAVAPLASPFFTGTPAAPTAAPGTNTTQLATTAFVAAASALDRARANHTGTQLAATISDFSAAVGLTTAGTKAHDQGTDTGLATGTGNAVTAAALRTHLDDATKHRVINNAGTGTTDLWSASKIISELASVSAGEPAFHQHTLDEVSDAGDLAALDTLDTDQIDDYAITGPKVAGGSVDPGPSRYWGTNPINQWGFHVFPGTPKVTTDSGEGLLSTTGGLHVVLGTANNRAASGADSRFPTADQKAALAGQLGSPSSVNKYLTLDWANAFPLANAAIITGTATTPGSITAAQAKLAVDTHAPSLANAAIITGTATTPGKVTAAQLKLAVDTHAAAGSMLLERELEDAGNFGGSNNINLFIPSQNIVITRVEGDYAAAGDLPIVVNFDLNNTTALGSLSISTVSTGSNRIYGGATVSWAVAAGQRVNIEWNHGGDEFAMPPTNATGPFRLRVSYRLA
jgi:hypothetical protein